MNTQITEIRDHTTPGEDIMIKGEGDMVLQPRVLLHIIGDMVIMQGGLEDQIDLIIMTFRGNYSRGWGRGGGFRYSRPGYQSTYEE